MPERLDTSPYDGPTRSVTVAVAGRAIRLVRPADPDRLLEDPHVVDWNTVDDYMPYWAYLWPGAFLLAEAVARGDWPETTRALELGCGLGLTGLVAVAQGIPVRFTDHDRTPLRFVQQSAQANGFDPATYSTGLFDWRDLPDPRYPNHVGLVSYERYPLILGADITYERRLTPLVAGVVAALLEPGGVALISDPNRSAAEGLRDAAEGLGLALETVTAEAVSEELGPLKGNIHQLRRKVDGG
jgi:predicted nicotinamide N-methyase